MSRKVVQMDMFDGRRKRRNKVRRAKESEEQEALFTWARIACQRYPELSLLHHIANGGRRMTREGWALKRRGVLPGMPDICLPVPRKGRGALYIELKRIGNEKGTSDAQVSIIDALRAYGNRVEVCAGWERARSVIEDYLKTS